MEVELAKSYGFCFGVKRAIEIAQSTPGAVTYGELIHNPLEIERLKRDYDVGLATSVDDITSDNVIIRTHGIVREDKEYLKQQGKRLIDATCPFVKKPQEIVEEMSKAGYDIVIFGDEAHPEVRAVKSYSHDLERTFVVSDPLAANDLKLKEKIAVISQTTKKISDFLQLVAFLIQNHKEVRVFNTICNATFKNQEAVKQLSQKADVMVIVGGKNSSNTKQLYFISQQHCSDSYLVENADELQKEWFEHKNLCGVSAGASTPEWLIQKVIQKIKQLKD
ncbi:MAG: 4-hydroxy-3-methylbut-2-enyl diphosphate reductase [Epsilonproteobacteria bacterium]|nr:4-hydroxy-3-methylbut-2-enyl diphosphate reductase [Campylobacterota bacterium]